MMGAMRRLPRPLAALVLALGLALATSACGDDGGDALELTIVGTEMAFDAPDTVEAGDYVVTFENAGAIYHEVAIKDASGQVLRRTQAPAGGTSTMEVTLEPGTYELGCFEPGHYEGGMFRTLTVE
jgi:manganese oxidase